MKINRRLNLVMDVEREDGSVVHVHHTPISQDAYDANWRLLTKAVSAMYMDRFMPPVAARVGYRMLQTVATDMGVNPAPLFSEIWRMTNVILPTDKGLAPTPFEVVMASGQGLDADGVDEVKNYVCFFTSASWVHPVRELKTHLYEDLGRSSPVLFVSSSCTEYLSSLTTSTPAAPTGGTVTSSVPH